jgi:hypothetical protein
MQNMEGILEKITKRLDFKIPKYKEVKTEIKNTWNNF